MQIKDVSGILTTHKLEAAPLTVLTPSREPYIASLMQPGGTIEATKERIGPADRELATEMIMAFLHRATDLASDLVVTPEYSTPWEVVEQKIWKGRPPERIVG